MCPTLLSIDEAVSPLAAPAGRSEIVGLRDVSPNALESYAQLSPPDAALSDMGTEQCSTLCHERG